MKTNIPDRLKNKKLTKPQNSEPSNHRFSQQVVDHTNVYKIDSEDTPREDKNNLLEDSDDKKSTSISNRAKIVNTVFLLIIFVVLAIGYNFLNNLDKTDSKQGDLSNNKDSTEAKVENIQISGDDETDILSRLGKVALIPKSVPQVATVNNIDDIKNQSFFKNAQNGDKVVIFIEDKTAYIFRPSTNQVINIGPIQELDQDTN